MVRPPRQKVRVLAPCDSFDVFLGLSSTDILRNIDIHIQTLRYIFTAPGALEFFLICFLVCFVPDVCLRGSLLTAHAGCSDVEAKVSPHIGPGSDFASHILIVVTGPSTGHLRLIGASRCLRNSGSSHNLEPEVVLESNGTSDTVAVSIRQPKVRTSTREVQREGK